MNSTAFINTGWDVTGRRIVDIFDDSCPEAKRRFTELDCVDLPNTKKEYIYYIKVQGDTPNDECKHGNYVGRHPNGGWYTCPRCEFEDDIARELKGCE